MGLLQQPARALLPWFDATLVARHAEALLRACASEVYVVIGHEADAVHRPIHGDQVHTVPNSRYRKGKSTSVNVDLAVLPPETEAIVIVAVDQPRPAWLVRRLLEAHAPAHALITCPSYGRRGAIPSSSMSHRRRNCGRSRTSGRDSEKSARFLTRLWMLEERGGA